MRDGPRDAVQGVVLSATPDAAAERHDALLMIGAMFLAVVALGVAIYLFSSTR